MKTRCPGCNTRYDIPPQALLEADGVARCFRCGTVFELVSENAATLSVISASPVGPPAELGEQSEITDGEAPESCSSDPDQDPARQQPGAASISRPGPQSGAEDEAVSPIPSTDESLPPERDGHPSGQPAQQASPSGLLQADLKPSERTAPPLPFAVPDDLEPLEPSPDVALDIADTLHESKSHRGFFYGLAAVLLAAGLGLQLAWQQRKDLLLEYPVLQPLCEFVECLPKVVRAPEKISILQRDIAPTANDPGSLTLSTRMRNDADTAQPLPDIQLSLLDDKGAVLIRRRLAPAEYLFPAPPKEKLMAPGEVVTISLDFVDPGHQASGFLIRFL